MYFVQISAETAAKLRALDEFNLDLKHRAARQRAADRFVVPGVLTSEQIAQVRGAGYTVEIVSDMTQVGLQRTAEVSRTNRFGETRGVREFGERAVLGRQDAVVARADRASRIASLIAVVGVVPEETLLLPIQQKGKNYRRRSIK